MEAIAASLPNAVLLSLFAYTLSLNELRRGASRKESTYGLLPAFYDGLLEAMPNEAYLVDGYEFAYPFKKRKQFLNGYNRIHQKGLKLSMLPNHYRKKVKAGFGLWLDYLDQEDYFTPKEFEQAVRHALDVSDRYVWIYSHGPRFFLPAVSGHPISKP
jgi:hypothetical protein